MPEGSRSDSWSILWIHQNPLPESKFIYSYIKRTTITGNRKIFIELFQTSFIWEKLKDLRRKIVARSPLRATVSLHIRMQCKSECVRDSEQHLCAKAENVKYLANVANHILVFIGSVTNAKSQYRLDMALLNCLWFYHSHSMCHQIEAPKLSHSIVYFRLAFRSLLFAVADPDIIYFELSQRRVSKRERERPVW